MRLNIKENNNKKQRCPLCRTGLITEEEIIVCSHDKIKYHEVCLRELGKCQCAKKLRKQPPKVEEYDSALLEKEAESILRFFAKIGYYSSGLIIIFPFSFLIGEKLTAIIAAIYSILYLCWLIGSMPVPME